MSERLDRLLADRAAELVQSSFTGVRAEWWWERRIGGGLAVCQELDPETMAREVSERMGEEITRAQAAVRNELGLDYLDPVVLTFEIPGDATTDEAARTLAERSAEPEGLAAGLYHRIEESLRAES